MTLSQMASPDSYSHFAPRSGIVSGTPRVRTLTALLTAHQSVRVQKGTASVKISVDPNPVTRVLSQACEVILKLLT